MIQATIRELVRGELDTIELSGIYIVRDGAHILYIGRSINVIDRLHQHINTASAIGDTIWLNRPQSLSWQIELMEPEECRSIAVEEGKSAFKDLRRPIGIESAERAMIKHYHPCINTANNPNRLPVPKHIKCGWIGQISVGATDNLF